MQTNGSMNETGRTNGSHNRTQTQPQSAVFTQGVGGDWYYELIHSSKNRINKINAFMRPYETNGRDVDPEVCFKFNGSRKFTVRNVKNWKRYFMSMILRFVLVILVLANFILVRLENSALSIHVLLKLLTKTTILSSIPILLPPMLITPTDYLLFVPPTLLTIKPVTK